jgi:hypothetical protein
MKLAVLIVIQFSLLDVLDRHARDFKGEFSPQFQSCPMREHTQHTHDQNHGSQKSDIDFDPKELITK